MRSPSDRARRSTERRWSPTAAIPEAPRRRRYIRAARTAPGSGASRAYRIPAEGTRRPGVRKDRPEDFPPVQRSSRNRRARRRVNAEAARRANVVHAGGFAAEGALSPHRRSACACIAASTARRRRRQRHHDDRHRSADYYSARHCGTRRTPRARRLGCRRSRGARATDSSGRNSVRDIPARAARTYICVTVFGAHALGPRVGVSVQLAVLLSAP